MVVTDPQNDVLSKKGVAYPQLGDGYPSALVNFGFIANAVMSTEEVVKTME